MLYLCLKILVSYLKQLVSNCHISQARGCGIYLNPVKDFFDGYFIAFVSVC